MDDFNRTRLPRASTQAFVHLRPPPKPEDDSNQQFLPDEACSKALADLTGVQATLQGAIDQLALPPHLEPALRFVKLIFRQVISFTVTINRQFYHFCSSLIAVIQSHGPMTAASTTLQELRSSFGDVIFALFEANNRENAQAASSMLDLINKICAPLHINITPDPIPEQKAVAAQDAAFFLPPQSLGDLLTISVDSSLLISRPLPPPPKYDNNTTASGAARRRGRPPKSAGGVGAGGGTETMTTTTTTASGHITGAKRRNKAPAVWTATLQRQLSTALYLVLGGNEQAQLQLKEQELQPSSSGQQNGGNQQQAPHPPPSLRVTLTPLLLAFIQELTESGACTSMRSMGVTIPRVRARLEAASFLEPEELLGAVSEESRVEVEAYLDQTTTDTRRGKVMGTADAFANVLGEVLDRVLAELSRTAKAARLETPLGPEAGDVEAEAAATAAAAAAEHARQRFVRVPLSIQANREPFRHGDWRKTPFVPRPYVRLEEYFIVEEATRRTIERKLKTRKAGGCSGAHCGDRDHLGTYSLEKESFETQCACLSRNTECDDSCGCDNKRCLNRAVTRRETVRLGEDVEEINSWGMDCYTRRNIQDAVLESQAFGEYQMPNYRAILAQIRAGVPPQRAAATAAGQHAAVAADDSPAPLNAEAIAVAGIDGGDGDGSGDATTTAAGRPKRGTTTTTTVPTTPITAVATVTTPTKPHPSVVERAVTDWIERTLVPAINRQGPGGWDLRAGLAEVKATAALNGDVASLRAAEAVESRLDVVGYNYFRIHPKGTGLVCRRPGGLPKLTFIEEYFGEIHTPSRWFELQDAVKKITGDELPDFYNIQLERPRDDPDGYDILFVDAAAKGAPASRMSHSCTPNCQAVVMACGGRLTIAMYTLRHVLEGEELTCDYSSLTESEKEFRDAICLCSTHMCRGSYLYFTGSRAFMQVMTRRHNFLHRQAILCLAGMSPVTEEDKERLRKYGIGSSVLGSEDRGDRVAGWLEKWAALICAYLDEEERRLGQELLENDPFKRYTEATAAAEAKGVVNNRVQNIAITMDKVRAFLSMPGQPQGPVLRALTDEEVVDHLWRGGRSIGKRLLKGVIVALGASSAAVRSLQAADDDEELSVILAAIRPTLSASMQRVCDVGMRGATTPGQARQCLQEFVHALRDADVEVGGA